MVVVAAVAAVVGVLGGCGSKPPADTAAFRARVVAFPGEAGSAQPRLTSGPDGKPTLSWLEPTDDGVVLRYATLDGDGFSELALLHPRMDRDYDFENVWDVLFGAKSWVTVISGSRLAP